MISYLSLGPTCIAAAILKAGNLRRHTYIFDWFKSGSIHYEEFLELSAEEFTNKHIVNPHLALEQETGPNKENNNTGTLKAKQTVYGTSYMHNLYEI